ncbi:MAG: hypothetical protein ACREQT_07880, partial [Candidatus Binataceae bacterium]
MWKGLVASFGVSRHIRVGRRAWRKSRGDMLNKDSFESDIGKGAKISGKLNFRAPAKIEGEVDGEISGDEILIAEG